MADPQLRGWKQIAAFLGTSPRTAQRWETEFSLPVRRLGSGHHASVFAHREELALWLESSAAPAAAGAATDCEVAAAPAGEEGATAAEDRAPVPAPADEEGPPPSEHFDGADNHAADTPPAPQSGSAIDGGPEEVLTVGLMTPDAATSPARGRRFWSLVALGALAVVVVVAASLGWVRSAGSTVQGKSVARRPEALVMLRITAPNGYVGQIGIRQGGSAHIAWPKGELVLKVRLEGERARVEVRDAAASASDEVVGAVGLSPGTPITLQLDPPLTLEWLSEPHSPPWSNAAK